MSTYCPSLCSNQRVIERCEKSVADEGLPKRLIEFWKEYFATEIIKLCIASSWSRTLVEIKFLTDDKKDLREMNEITLSVTTCKCDPFQQFGSYMFIRSCLSSENRVLKVINIRYRSELSFHNNYTLLI